MTLCNFSGRELHNFYLPLLLLISHVVCALNWKELYKPRIIFQRECQKGSIPGWLEEVGS